MFTAVPLLCLALAVEAPRVEVKFEQVTPAPPEGKLLGRSKDQKRAVVLVHGLHPSPVSSSKVSRAYFSSWQEPQSAMARELAKQADVYAVAYSQDAPLPDIIAECKMADHVTTLRKLGYDEIVLVGHSAGGIIARHFVEDHPRAGVTKVIQVCSPNGGSHWARVPLVRGDQRKFVRSLTKESRQDVLTARKDKRIPNGVEFLCVVGTSSGDGDGIVARECQWTPDLREQGVPAVAVPLNHLQAMRSTQGVNAIAAALQKKHQRWDKEEVERSLPRILRD